MAETPEDLADVNLALADESLRRAPLNVRKAGAWIAAQKEHHLQRQVATYSALGLILGAFPLAGIVATLAGNNEPVGLAAMLVCMGIGGTLAYSNWKRWGRTQAWANALVLRWQQIEELGIPADLAPDGEAETSALARMVGRIEALAGPDRQPLREAAVQALERSRRLESELVHLEKASTGQPDADAVLDAARERIHTELARTRARVAEVYAGLVEIEAGQGSDAIEGAVRRIAAELEVESGRDEASQKARAARVAQAGRAPTARTLG